MSFVRSGNLLAPGRLQFFRNGFFVSAAITCYHQTSFTEQRFPGNYCFDHPARPIARPLASKSQKMNFPESKLQRRTSLAPRYWKDLVSIRAATRCLSVCLCVCILLCLAATQPASSQGTARQYERRANLGGLLAGGVDNETIELTWFGDQDRYAHFRLLTGASNRQTMVVDTSTGEMMPAENCEAYVNEFGSEAEQSATGLKALERLEPSVATGGSTEILFENRLKSAVKLFWNDTSGQLTEYATIAAGQSHRQHTYAGHVWVLSVEKDQPLGAVRAGNSSSRFLLDETTQPPTTTPRQRNRRDRARSPEGSLSPDGSHRVAIRDHNVVLTQVADESEQILTTDGDSQNEYRTPVWWSPDSKHFALFRTQLGDRREVTLVESSPKDQLQPKTTVFGYAKPGDTLDHPRLQVFGIDGVTHYRIDPAIAPNPFGVTNVHWHSDGQSVRMLYNQRGHQRLAVLAIDVADGKTRAIVDEVSKTFVDYAGKQFLQFIDDRDEVIWMSERSGWNHLYLIRQSTGEVIRPITSGQYVVRDVVKVDTQRRTVLAAVGGFYPDQDPYHVHLVRYSLDDDTVVPLTDGDGNHSWDFSPNEEFLVARYSRVDLPPVTELRSMADGKRLATLAQADASKFAQAAGGLPRRFVAKGRDGETDIHGMIVLPYDFDPESDQRYPVLELIYAGPHSAHVPKSFGRFIDLRKTADLGFIVVRIDAMGTSHRSKAFHDVCWKNLADAGFPDRIAWMKAAAKEIPQMDLERVGIWGGSAGGQNAMRALIDHGDFYRAAFADCGCHDNRMDKIWWNELWMGWPIGPHYEQQSNVTGAHKVTGKLMLSVGELDRNVDPASTLQVVDALIKADKDFELLLIPGAGYGAGGSPYGDRRRLDFFVRHLWNTEPRQ